MPPGYDRPISTQVNEPHTYQNECAHVLLHALYLYQYMRACIMNAPLYVVYIYLFIYIYLYLFIYMCVYMYLYTHTNIHVCAQDVHVYVCICMHVYMYA